MNHGQQILFFFSALGVFNGFIISTYLLFFKKSKSVAPYFLGLLLLAFCVRITRSIFLYFYPELPGIYLQISLSGCLLIGPSLYYFTKAALSQIQKVPTVWKWTYGLWILAIAVTGLLLPYQSHPYAWDNYIEPIINRQLTFHIILSGWMLKSVFVKLAASNQKLSLTEKSLLSVFIANVIIPLASLGVFTDMCISGALFFSLILYLNIPLFLSRKKVNDIFLDGQEQNLERYANKKIADEQAMALTERLEEIILEQELYKDPNLKLNDLAKKINISGHQLSQLLNDNLGKSFSAYINEYRINEACKQIVNDKGIKLEAIGYDVGFNSKSTFYAAFKKHKHTTPTLYKEQVSTVSPI